MTRTDAQFLKNHPEYQYLGLLQNVMQHGAEKPVHNTPDTTIKSLFGQQSRYDLSQGFPLLTTKKVFLRGIVHELLWFIKGDSNIKYLVDNDVHIWDEWPYRNYTKAVEEQGVPELTQEEFIAKIKEDDAFAKQWGDLGNVYGVQWRRWPTTDGRTVDQLGWVIDKLRTAPYRKHLVVSAWNPEYIYEMAASPEQAMVLPPCHTLFHFNVTGKRLSLQLYQRSADLFLGVPFNIASYALLLQMVAHVTDLEPGDFIHTLGDAHIYSNHFDQVREQLTRQPRPFPTMRLNPEVTSIDGFTYDDFTVEDYDPYPPIKGKVTVAGGF